jgi:hypothetical protein
VSAVERLPKEFQGVRAPDEVMGDLATIANAQYPWNLVAASVRSSDNRSTAVLSGGALSIDQTGGHVDLYVAEEPIARFLPTAIRGGWLATHDGADYFVLRIDAGDTLISLSDAYP